MNFITILKIIALFGILIFSFLFAILPVKWERFRKAPIALSVANAFSGGLFITAG
jgi:hypothetical protein